MWPARLRELDSPLNSAGGSAHTSVASASPATTAATSSLSAQNSGRSTAVKPAATAGSTWPRSSGRSSARHFVRPPSSTATFSKPKERSSHQTRAAHWPTESS